MRLYCQRRHSSFTLPIRGLPVCCYAKGRRGAFPNQEGTLPTGWDCDSHSLEDGCF